MKTKNHTIPILETKTSKGKNLFKKILDVRARRERDIAEKVIKIIEDVRREKDKALLKYTEMFDKIKLNLSEIRISSSEIEKCSRKAPEDLKKAIIEAKKRIEKYHQKQMPKEFTLHTEEGKLSMLIKPLEKVGLYVPGGHTVYPSSVLMNAIPAMVAGVKRIIVITPPKNNLDPGIAFTLKTLGISETYRIGGAHGIAALAYGTDTIPSVDKIVGPGNSYVQMAKKLLYGVVDIDSVAGPSEVVIVTDSSTPPEWVALDLLAQAEHGSGDELAVCFTEDIEYAKRIAKALIDEIEKSPSKETFKKLPSTAITIFVTESRDESFDLVNILAPEHLQIMTATSKEDVKKVKNASAIFVGKYTPVALGDYFIGTNHVLPTGGAARFASPLGVDSFLKRISVATVTSKGLVSSEPYVSTFARYENFIHHALSVERRKAKIIHKK
ncbi:MAG: histidinol dehydrogenase [Chitinispirillaceae bacterium]|nr:histidinol dehydrogenase [Chitinispirillaceae bacterium]